MENSRRGFFSFLAGSGIAVPLSLPEPKRAEALRPGATYVLTFEDRLTGQDIENIRQCLKEYERTTGCKFMVLGGGVSIAELNPSK